MADWNASVVDEFRANNGVVGGMFATMQLLLLSVTGAKSGKTYIKPLAYTKDGDNYVIIASKGGAPHDPDWYRNLLAHPEVTVEVGTEKFKAHAKPATGKDRERLYSQHAAAYPVFNDYKAKTTREIPVVVLTRQA